MAQHWCCIDSPHMLRPREKDRAVLLSEAAGSGGTAAAPTRRKADDQLSFSRPSE